MRFVILGLSITSSWGNGHATTFRGLVRELTRRGHEVLFSNATCRGMPRIAICRSRLTGETALYSSLGELQENFSDAVAGADCVIVGSYVPQGIDVARWVCEIAAGLTSFYDIDTPVTLAALARGDCEYLSRELVRRFDLYLSFTGGPTLRRLEMEFGAQNARPLYCSVDPQLYFPEPEPEKWQLGYLGTYSADRQPALNTLLLAPAAMLPTMRFAVAGPQYPAAIIWPANVTRIEHLPPNEHRGFYNSQRFTLNITRADMRAAGYSPSVRLFEAAACAVPMISDRWDGLENFFAPGAEIFVAESAAEVVALLRDLPEAERRRLGERARARVLAKHTAAHRAAELEDYVRELQPVAAR